MSPDGIGLAQAREGKAVAVYPGKTVYTPPGEWHWHGATESNFITQFALSETIPAEEGPPVTWGDYVTGDEYRAADETATRWGCGSPNGPAPTRRSGQSGRSSVSTLD